MGNDCCSDAVSASRTTEGETPLLNDSNEQIIALESKLEALRGKKHDLETQRKEGERELNAKNEEIYSLKQKLNELKSTSTKGQYITQMEELLKNTQTEYEQYKNSQDDERRQYLQDLKNQNIALTESLREYDDIVSSLKSRRKSMVQSNQLPSNDSDERVQQQNGSSDETQSVASVSKNDELRLELSMIQNEIVEKDQKINELESQIQSLKNINAEMNAMHCESTENEVDDEKMEENKESESTSSKEQTEKQMDSNAYNELVKQCDEYKLQIKNMSDLQAKLENMNESEIITEQNKKIIALETELNHSKNVNDTQIETIDKFKQLVKAQNEELEKMKNANIEQIQKNNVMETELKVAKERNMSRNMKDLGNAFNELIQTNGDTEPVAVANDEPADDEHVRVKSLSNHQIERMSELNMEEELETVRNEQSDTINALKSQLAQSQNEIIELKKKHKAEKEAQMNELKDEYKKELTMRLKANRTTNMLEKLFGRKLNAVGVDLDGVSEMSQNEIKLLQKKVKCFSFCIHFICE